ncbi:hypothetical protein Agabi119p4_2550 [Agaricus bisporus var. burnettii]|uniref:Uncharacterized protein n=1 Tax=Agaricus bisporus var. burnettii TaxID=192524 RepID=A0A8H7F9P4_AGABI|nr:hypothetical protein Agabi119p4_2550 [Agaricus bisporus var. burnettii]
MQISHKIREQRFALSVKIDSFPKSRRLSSISSRRAAWEFGNAEFQCDTLTSAITGRSHGTSCKHSD